MPQIFKLSGKPQHFVATFLLICGFARHEKPVQRGDMVPVTCPTCFEEFEVAPPALHELPADWDYDCEVCCRPMVIRFEADDGEIFAHAAGLAD